MVYGVMGASASLSLAPLLASAHNLGMDQSAQLQQLLADGDLAAAVTPAQDMLSGFGDSVTAQTTAQLHQMIQEPQTRHQGLHSLLALHQTLQARSSTASYVKNFQGEPVSLNLTSDQSDFVAETAAAWGERLFARAKAFRRGPIRRLQDHIFAQMLSDEALKRRMIAFMDVAAGQQDPERIATLLRSYFPRHEIKAKGLLGLLLKVGTWSWLPDRLIAWGLKQGIQQMASRFLAGETIEQALNTAAQLQTQGVHTSLDVVRERVVSQPEADDYTEKVLNLMNQWADHYQGESRTPGGVPVRHVSVKLSALTPRFEALAEQQVRVEAGARLLKIFQAAKYYAAQGKPILVNIDLEEFQVRDLSYRLLWDVFNHPNLAGWEEAGLVIQAYLKDSEVELMRTVDAARLTGKRPQIRVVKGAYHKYEQIEAVRQGWDVPVFLRQADTNRNFRRLVELTLLNQDVLRPATGSHNIRDVGYSQEVREALGVSRDLLEAQVLLGVGDPIAAAVKVLGIPARYYGPFGTTGEAIGYLVRRLAEVGPQSAIGQTHVAGEFDDYQRNHADPHQRGEHPLGSGQRQQPRFELTPEADFSDLAVHQQMEQALTKLLDQPLTQRPVVAALIGDELTRIHDAQRLQPILNPANLSEPVGQVVFANQADIDRALVAAQQGYAEWSGFSSDKRARALEHAATLVMERQYEIAAAIVAEAGKPWDSALAEIREAVDFLRSYALDSRREALNYTARGVGVAISPFNFPFAITMGQLAAGLALGNAMISKPAEDTPLSAKLAVEILRDAGVPKAAIQLLPGLGATVGHALVAARQIDFVSFTGSLTTAQLIQRTAAAFPPQRGGVKIVVAETGGKNPMIVDDTADLDVAVAAVLQGAFQFNGQRCSATSRVIVVASQYERFIQRLIEGAQAMVLGNPRNPYVQLGPQISQASLEKAQSYVEQGLAASHADLVYKGKVSHLTDHGFYMAPHIFTHVMPESPLAQEEIFGPVLSVIRAAGFDEALAIANDSPYALTAGLISRDPEHISQFFNRMEAGNKYVNRSQTGARPWETPFGGFKNSGTGPKAGGRHIVARFGKPKVQSRRSSDESLRAYSEEKTVTHREHIEDRLKSTRKIQQQWSTSSLDTRLDLLHSLRAEIAQLTTEINQAETSTSRLTVAELNTIDTWLATQAHQLPQYLVPTETIGLPGERNEIGHDQPLGVGFVWGERESFSDMFCAAAAAVAMGNAVLLPDSCPASITIQSLFERAGAPTLLVATFSMQSRAMILQAPQLDFVVAHGPTAAVVQLMTLAVSAETSAQRTNFLRFIGVDDQTTESRYLSYFAHETVRTERTLRHGADLDLR